MGGSFGIGRGRRGRGSCTTARGQEKGLQVGSLNDALGVFTVRAKPLGSNGGSGVCRQGDLATKRRMSEKNVAQSTRGKEIQRENKKKGSHYERRKAQK